MKTIILSLTILFCAFSVCVNAQPAFIAENNDPAIVMGTAPAAIQAGIFEKIQQCMRVPESMKTKVSSERVRVVFTIDENGKAHVLDIGTRRPELKASVTSQFEAIDFSDSKGTNGQEFSIWLNFKVM
ncbi:MAG: hypothetical protein ABIQ40_02875 [Bacteroidia bacterium]